MHRHRPAVHPGGLQRQGLPETVASGFAWGLSANVACTAVTRASPAMKTIAFTLNPRIVPR